MRRDNSILRLLGKLKHNRKSGCLNTEIQIDCILTAVLIFSYLNSGRETIIRKSEKLSSVLAASCLLSTGFCIKAPEVHVSAGEDLYRLYNLNTGEVLRRSWHDAVLCQWNAGWTV